uniref:Uncharacterized protein n=1 Tax=Spironucleus salmonicida TaxID=348837 RepID=V6M0Z9_9EUKA|eukprot:EST46834.1 Hypothetical protein SS50377_13132 [Spironucleus salmonicida]
MSTEWLFIHTEQRQVWNLVYHMYTAMMKQASSMMQPALGQVWNAHTVPGVFVTKLFTYLMHCTVSSDGSSSIRKQRGTIRWRHLYVSTGMHLIRLFDPLGQNLAFTLYMGVQLVDAFSVDRCIVDT